MIIVLLPLVDSGRTGEDGQNAKDTHKHRYSFHSYNPTIDQDRTSIHEVKQIYTHLYNRKNKEENRCVESPSHVGPLPDWLDLEVITWININISQYKASYLLAKCSILL